MAKKITWEDKEHILPYGTRENQVWDLDMNEIKTVVNANADSLAGLEGGYQGVLLIADTPINDGYYLAGESGTYTNAGGLVIDLTNTITFINVSATQTVFTKTVIPVDTPILNTFDKDNTTDAFSGKAIDEGTTDKFLEVGKNKFNSEIAVDNKYYNNSDGTILSFTGWSITGLIPTVPNTQYTLWKSGGAGDTFGLLHFWDVDGVWVGNQLTMPVVTTLEGGLVKQFITPSNVYYVSSWSQRPTQTFEEFKNSITLEEGLVKTVYEPYKLVLKESQLPTSIAERYTKNEVEILTETSPITVLKSGNYYYTRTYFNSDKDLVQKFDVLSSENFKNKPINFYGVWLISNLVTDSVVNYESGDKIADQQDDATPNSYNATYIGANHGCSDMLEVTATSHGKTTVDIGSEWTDSLGVKFYILRIVDADKLWMISEDTSVNDIWDFNPIMTGNLTHSSGATNTGAITVVSKIQSQLKPSIKNHTKQVFINDTNEVIEDGIYTANYLNIVDDYMIVNPSKMLDNLIANVGTTYTDDDLNTAFQNGSDSVKNKICYQVQQNGSIVILYGWLNSKDIDFGYMGFMQAEKLNTSVYPNLKIYFPKALPISDGTKTWDFRTNESWDVAPAAALNLTDTYWEVPTSPPDRMVQYLCSGATKKVGFAMGYDLNKGLGKDRNTLTNNAWYLYTSRKSYPFAINNKNGTTSANTWLSCVGYRSFFDAESSDKGYASSLFTYKVGNDVIIVFDYNTATFADTLKLPSEFNGMSVTVIEKSANVTIHTNEVMQFGLTVSVNYGNYGYGVLKLN